MSDEAVCRTAPATPGLSIREKQISVVYIVLCCAVFCCVALRCVALRCVTLHYVALRCF